MKETTWLRNDGRDTKALRHRAVLPAGIITQPFRLVQSSLMSTIQRLKKNKVSSLRVLVELSFEPLRISEQSFNCPAVPLAYGLPSRAGDVRIY